MTDGSPGAPRSLGEVETAIAALEAQQVVLGDAVVETAVGPLLERHTALRAARIGERRKLVTVLFADFPGFTGLSRRLDDDPRAPQVRVDSVRRLRHRAGLVGDDAVAAGHLARPAAVELLG